MMQIFSPHLKLTLIILMVFTVINGNLHSQEIQLRQGHEEYVSLADSLVINSQYGASIALYDSALLRLENDNEIGVRVNVLQKKANALMNLNRTEDAEKALRESLPLALDIFGESSVEVSTTYFYLGKNLSNQRKRFEEASGYLDKSLTIREKLSPARPELVAETLTRIGAIHMYSNKYDVALQDYAKAEAIWKDLPESTLPSERSRTYFGIGWTHIALGQPVEALEALRESLRLNEKTFHPGHGRISNDLNLMGRAYSDLGQYENALEIFEKTAEIRVSTLGSNHPNVARTYISMAGLFFAKGEANNAVDYMVRAIAILEDHHQWNDPVFIGPLSNLAQYYRQMGSFGEQAKTLQKAAAIASNADRNNPRLLTLYLNIAQLAIRQGNWNEFEDAMGKAEVLAKKLYGNQHPNYAVALRIRSLGEMELGRYREALDFAKISRDILRSRLPLANQNQVSADLLIAKLYHHLDLFDSALIHVDKAINLAASNGETDTIRYEGYDDVYLHGRLTDGLYTKGRIFRRKYELSADLDDLENALKFSLDAVSSLESTRNKLVSNQVGQELFNLGETAYIDALEIAYELYVKTKNPDHIETAFNISERSKGFLFLRELSQRQALKYGAIPDSLLKRDLDITSQIRYYSRLRLNASARGQKEQLKKHRDKIFDLNQAHKELVEEIEKLHPDFYGFKYKPEVLSIDEAQEFVSRTGKGIIEFMVGLDHIFSFTITGDTVVFNRSPRPENFRGMLGDFRRSYSDYNYISENREISDRIFTTHGSDLYNLLIAPSSKLLSETKELIIIPHDVLYDTNFELFLTKPIEGNFNYSTLPYFVRNKAVTYASSLTVHDRLENITHPKADKNFGGFATDLSSFDETIVKAGIAQRAPGNKTIATVREVESISDFLGGDSFIEDEATEENFKELGTSYNVVHLAMHGTIDNGNPFNSALVFNKESESAEDGLLTLEEIFGLNLESNLVVLSACNTGFNTGVINGEGMVSVSRGFMFSGVPSIVMSLWAIPDEATADIMLDFYKNLDSGMDKSISLQKAKLGYIKNTTNDFDAHPYFWAGMSHMGNTAPLNLKSTNYLIWILLLSLGAIIVIVLRSRARKQV